LEALSSLKISRKNILIYAKHQKETPNAFGSVLKVKIRFLQLLGWQSDMAPSGVSNLQFNFLHREP